ncbi:hypothetical protein Agub_g2649, partial [Astrephomene gubernaculifera]
ELWGRLAHRLRQLPAGELVGAVGRRSLLAACLPHVRAIRALQQGQTSPAHPPPPQQQQRQQQQSQGPQPQQQGPAAGQGQPQQPQHPPEGSLQVHCAALRELLQRPLSAWPEVRRLGERIRP